MFAIKEITVRCRPKTNIEKYATGLKMFTMRKTRLVNKIIFVMFLLDSAKRYFSLFEDAFLLLLLLLTEQHCVLP